MSKYPISSGKSVKLSVNIQQIPIPSNVSCTHPLIGISKTFFLITKKKKIKFRDRSVRARRKLESPVALPNLIAAAKNSERFGDRAVAPRDEDKRASTSRTGEPGSRFTGCPREPTRCPWTAASFQPDEEGPAQHHQMKN